MREKAALRPLPDMNLLMSYEKAGETRKVPNTLLVGFHGHDYSVPKDYIGKLVRTVEEGNEIVIYYNGKEIARHIESDKKTNYLYEHYVGGMKDAVGDALGDDGLDALAKHNLEAFGK